MKIAIVRSSWLTTSKINSFNVHFFLYVIEAIKAENINQEDDRALMGLVRRVEQVYPSGKNIEPIEVQLNNELEKLEDCERKANSIREKISLLKARGW